MAIAGPRVVSTQQQELVCLRSAHVDCPRYLRAAAAAASTVRGRRFAPRLHPATTVALIVLALSAGVSFGFVIQRGGIDLPVAAVSPSAGGAVASGSLVPSGVAALPSPSPSASAATVSPSAPSATPTPAASPTAAATPSPKPTTAPTASGGIPSADRLAVIKPCPGQSGCWVYNVRAGDNLWSIAHWFGVPLDTIYKWNPTVQQSGIHPGTPLKIPTPTR